MDKVLRVENLSREGILSRITFEMESGEMLAVMGPSGSGKSTLLYHAAGMVRPSEGEIWLEDRKISGMSEDERAKIRLHHMGFVFQQMNMVAGLNILDNILLPAVQANRSHTKKTGKKSKTQLTEKAKTLMQKLSVSGLEERRITQVSGGQLQRACICRSMINSPKILFADEPTGALNRSAAKEVMAQLVSLNREGTAVLTVTHDSRVAACCERILYLLDGSIRGELTLGKLAQGEVTLGETADRLIKQREEKVDRWLGQMGW